MEPTYAIKPNQPTNQSRGGDISGCNIHNKILDDLRTRWVPDVIAIHDDNDAYIQEGLKNTKDLFIIITVILDNKDDFKKLRSVQMLTTQMYHLVTN